MSSLLIPADWKVKRSTPFFTKENVPAALLSHHNTAAGVFGQLCVMEGTVTYYGFARFNIHFWVAEETDGENGLFHAKKA